MPTNASEILFISDLHLDSAQPQISSQFVQFIQARACHARALYILGDLFEVWLGDDDDTPHLTTVFHALQELSAQTDIYFMHGNRDFLVGSQLAQRLNMTLLDEPYLLHLGEQRVALMHGDLLCSDDVDYQNFRNMVRQPQWQQEFLDQPLAQRQAIAATLREQSTEAMQDKSHQIMDVNQQTVSNYFDEYRVDCIIHGHTHRPAIHQLSSSRSRIVLGDWCPQASYLSWQQGQFTLHDRRV